ncbi:MAG: class I SAM-dependent methyltransferase [Gemmatimonadetes bacterium]|nr:class I SAM-dependent methyltransferase [Gemmatimonadota bacterium]
MRRSYRGIPINTSENTHETVFDLIKGDPSKTIVDVPAGGGAFVQRLKDHGFENVWAFDIENLLEIEHDPFVQGDMTETFPLASESCDVVVCIDGIEHVSRQCDFISEVNRVLKIGGEVVISTPNISSLRSRWRWFWTGHHHKCGAPLDEAHPSPLHHVGMISFPEIRYLLHTHGFRISEVTTNRVKAISWVYALLLPVAYLSTRRVYRRAGRKEGTVEVNREILKTVFSKDVLFGETLIVKATKEADAPQDAGSPAAI